MSSVRTFDVTLIVKSFYSGSVEATTHEDAVEQTFHIWRTAVPHPFEQCDDSELIDVVIEAVHS